jgi:hypothetical protein
MFRFPKYGVYVCQMSVLGYISSISFQALRPTPRPCALDDTKKRSSELRFVSSSMVTTGAADPLIVAEDVQNDRTRCSDRTVEIAVGWDRAVREGPEPLDDDYREGVLQFPLECRQIAGIGYRKRDQAVLHPLLIKPIVALARTGRQSVR